MRRDQRITVLVTADIKRLVECAARHLGRSESSVAWDILRENADQLRRMAGEESA